MSKQLLRCGTSIGANIREAQDGESGADFVHKLSISLKESGELLYWLDLLHATQFLTTPEYESISKDAIVRWSSFAGHKTLLILCTDEKKININGSKTSASI